MSKRRDGDRFKELGGKMEALKSSDPKAPTRPTINSTGKTQRQISIHFRASTPEHELIQSAAERMGLTISSFVRLAVREKLGIT